MITKDQAILFIRNIAHTTCYRWLSLSEIVEPYLIIRHQSHAEYIDRMTGNKTCTSWHGVFEYEEHPKDHLKIMHPLKRITGRYNKQKRQELLNFVDGLRHINAESK